ncbi:MAG: hypothetical protein DCC71_25760, partial [Proteobacteria bacterium]
AAVAALYAGPARPDEQAERARLEAEARAEIAALPLGWHAPERVASALPLSDPCLALAGTYERAIPRWEGRLAALGGDLAAFVAAAKEAAQAADPHVALAGISAAAR